MLGKRARDALGLLPIALTLVAEGAWIAVVYTLLQSASREPAWLGLPRLAAVAALGALVAAFGARRIGGRWPAAAVGLVLLVGLAGWASAPPVRALLVSTAPLDALSAHPGGWFAGLAFLRGIAHGRRAVDPVRVASLLALGVAVVCACFLVGGALADPGRSAFQQRALPEAVVFAGTVFVALALARIAQLGGIAGFDWRRNPAWLALLVVLVGGILVVAVPASFALGPLVILLVALLPVPMFVAGLFAGIDRRGWRVVALVGLVAVAAIVAIRLFGGPGGAGEAGGPGQAVTPTPPDQAWMTVAAWTAVIALVAIVVAVLAALWMRQALASGDEDVAEERTIDYGAGSPARRRRRPRLFGRLPLASPRDAVEAYLAALRELERDDVLRRASGETPAEHARRVRAAAPDGWASGGAALGLLAADYELARFGGRSLTASEQRRAIARWRRVRTALVRRPRP